MNFAAAAEKYRGEFTTLLEQWVRIPSVYEQETVTNSMPFGAEVAKALLWFKTLGDLVGFRTKWVDGYATHIEYGEGAEYVYVFGHCDVVPPGEGWLSEPFILAKSGDKLIGRGVIDDKGPLLAACMALKLIKDNKLSLKRNIRIVAGGNEESGFACIRYYFQREPLPSYAFTPDAKFPVINGEKGAMTLQIKGTVENNVVSILGGSAHNTIPGDVIVKNCVIPKEHIQEFLAKEQITYEYIQDGNQIAGFALKGRGGHSAKPEKANNPIEKLFKLFHSRLQEQWWNSLATLFDGTNRDGGLLDLNKEGFCGSFTMVPTIIRLENGQFQLTINIRYPETIGINDIMANLSEYFIHQGMKYELKMISHKKPFYMAKDSWLVKKLQDIYVKHTGDINNPVRVTSAGTYAAEMKNAVIFGGEMPDGSSGNAHMPDEYGSEAAFVRSIGIYAEALWTLGNQ